MDIGFFLKERTRFIEFLYETAIKPFEDIIQAIENEEEPYVPVYAEDGEPQYLSEWIDASTAIETLGQSAISMLSASLDLFLGEWLHQIERNYRVRIEVNFKKHNGLIQCSEIFKELKIDASECPAKLDIIEQIRLTRNRAQHPESITSLRVSHTKSDLEKFPNPYFVRDSELRMVQGDREDGSFFFPPAVTPTKEMIREAIHQVNLFCGWLDENSWKERNT